jgi:cytidine deaminase
MTTDLETRLVEAALAVRGQAYARYSRFAVGAALAAVDGQIFTGVNVENASYGLTICAERSAVFAAVAAGCRKFTLLALASDGGVTPCGACRQVLAEFCDDLPIVLVDALGHQPQQRVQLAQLLPGRFSF